MARIGIIGGGPAGLMAAEAAVAGGHRVDVFEAKPTMARKFLLAGKSGLNLTHSEPHELLCQRFGQASERLREALDSLTAQDLCEWASVLGIDTFTGTSGRIFPKLMKASPLLRAWLGRLARQGVGLHTRHRWVGFDGEAVMFETSEGHQREHFDAIVLALGGASWPRLGSDAAWVPWLAAKGVAIRPFRPANCGFDVGWSPIFAERFAGTPVKAVTATSDMGTSRGEFVIGATGVEGSLVYAHSAALRDRLERDGTASLDVDLAPGRTMGRLTSDIARQDRKASLSNRLRKGAGLDPVKIGLLRETNEGPLPASPEALAQAIKAVRIAVLRPRPIAEAISSAGGIAWESLDETLMLSTLPGVFVAGEMLDWEAPTGGYLLTACLATGRAAGMAASRWACK